MGSNYDKDWNETIGGNGTCRCWGKDPNFCWEDDDKHWGYLYVVSTPVTGGGGSGGAGGDTSAVAGVYAFSGNYNGAVTLSSDGTWSYSGNKTGVAADSGTYSVSGNAITFNWIANNMDLSETITVDTNGSTSEWSTSGYTFFSMLFGTTDNSIELEYSEN